MTLAPQKLLLASASPARKKTLQNAGINPAVQVSSVDEEALLATLPPNSSAQTQVQTLASAKTADVVATILNEAGKPDFRVVVGCDSMLEMNGEVVGKPETPEIARERLRKMRGNFGDLHTGHCVIDLQTGKVAEGVSTARVYIGEMTDAEIDAYIATGEPLVVAGSFTIDGIGGPFVERIEGDPHGIVGISLPLLRKLLQELGLNIAEFWEK
ncbi:MAG: nucleoside triphosphate pyrophosphatase [Arcanobacterium sp.]|nr:nucleoside triphosphate pyrophosphatase [Arcanobacterium sp.]